MKNAVIYHTGFLPIDRGNNPRFADDGTCISKRTVVQEEIHRIADHFYQKYLNGEGTLLCRVVEHDHEVAKRLKTSNQNPKILPVYEYLYVPFMEAL